MPIRFQVDPDFYDHPKALDLSDAAVALWTRAGSYSAAKLTDGFVPERALALLSSTHVAAAEELRRCGLWHRVKGGFRFHQWEERNLTKQRVQADLDADRQRKRRDREAARNAVGQSKPIPPGGNGRTVNQPGYPQASGEDQTLTQNTYLQPDGRIVRSDSNRSPTGFQPESERNPTVSVSVSVSESVSGSGRGESRAGYTGPPPEPPPNCPEHIGMTKPPPCGACADARRAHEAWALAKAEWQRNAPKCRAHRGQLAHNCAPCRADQLAAPDD